MGRQRPLLADALALTGLAALYHFRTRPWMYTWGARDEELTASLPGDELVAGDPVRTTRAVTVDAPVSDVWPWLAQIGEDRGGTRLLVRGSGKPVGHFWFDIPHFIMEQKMMRGIAARAQRTRHRAALGA